MHHSQMPASRRRSTRVAGALLVALAVAVAAGCSSGKDGPTASGATSTDASYQGATIVVAGEGQVKGTPDTLTMNIGVQTTDASAQTALDRNNTEAAALIDTLTRKGVAKKDIQTTDLSISPKFDLGGHVTGYTVANTVTVTLHHITNAGTIIDAAARAAGNDITLDSVALSIGDTSALLRQAREAAVKQAMSHAGQLASAAGVKLGVVRKIDDTATQLPRPQFLGVPATSGKASSVPIEAGQQQLTVDVSVELAIRS